MVGQAREGTSDKTRMEPPTKPGWAEPWTTTRSQCSRNHPGHHVGVHATRVNHEVYATRNQQGTRPAHVQPAEWGSVCGGRLGQYVEEQGTWASRTRRRSKAGCGRPEDGGVWTAKIVTRPPQQPARLQYAIYWTPLTHPARPQHTIHWAPRTRKRHQQEHWPQRPTESSDPTQHAKGRTGDCPESHKETTTRWNVTQGGRGKCLLVQPGKQPKILCGTQLYATQTREHHPSRQAIGG